jgi:hypothetical protein
MTVSGGDRRVAVDVNFVIVLETGMDREYMGSMSISLLLAMISDISPLAMGNLKYYIM